MRPFEKPAYASQTQNRTRDEVPCLFFSLFSCMSFDLQEQQHSLLKERNLIIRQQAGSVEMLLPNATTCNKLMLLLKMTLRHAMLNSVPCHRTVLGSSFVQPEYQRGQHSMLHEHKSEYTDHVAMFGFPNHRETSTWSLIAHLAFPESFQEQ